ncbi:MAG: YeeE/YedE family protein [Rhodocyclaceae bacterium]|nr:YeeE/YedE family protein [Rhodocyclaceae bacterium]MCP5240293.1 YeeE/YedE family protein [Zoogloeaceae bacterium]MCB1911944.1 YeeE/YedE family protein [Rhodocyclaceae bacterium]MCP5253598.1 YeeE/YedE family protein [Zoogloeaceae bacterium]MCP5295053.1 YeeE/YedE family protein [Zoogloeaceae bacterium]
MDETLIASSTIAWLAFALGVVFGFVGNKTNFCTLGAISDAMNIGDWGRMRMWALAMAVAIFGASALQFAGLIDVHKSIYTGSRLLWLSHVVGGLLFGAGMTLASGCGSKTLIRIGTGNLKSLVVFAFLGIAAYMTLRGLFGTWRVAALDSVAIDLAGTQDLPAILARQAGMAADTAMMAAATVVGGALALFALSSRDAWRSDVLLGGTVIGAVIVAGWYLSGHTGYVPEHPDTLEEAFIGTNSGRMESFTFVAPYAFSLELLMFWSDTSKIVTFGIAAALGVMAGSALFAAITRSFRLESFRDSSDLLRHIGGAIMMGFGGVTALGCTIGQGISGISTLAIGSLITTAAIIAGSALTMKIEYWRLMREA